MKGKIVFITGAISGIGEGCASKAVLRIYSDERFKSTLIKAGRETVNKKYDIRRVSEESAKMFEELTR